MRWNDGELRSISTAPPRARYLAHHDRPADGRAAPDGRRPAGRRSGKRQCRSHGKLVLRAKPQTMRVSILTVSDSVSGGKYEDRSGPAVLEHCRSLGYPRVVCHQQLRLDKLRTLESCHAKLMAIASAAFVWPGKICSPESNVSTGVSDIETERVCRTAEISWPSAVALTVSNENRGY